MNLLVSVVIPTYNREKHIKRALDSVLSQSYQNFEIRIIDDGSTDDTKSIVEPYLRDARVFYALQKNQGVAAASNNGIRSALGSHIALLHSDDWWRDSEKLKKQVEFLEKNNEYILVGGGIIRVKENGQEILRTRYPSQDDQIRKSMLFSCLFASSAVIFSKKAWEKTGGFDETLETCEDWDLWLRIGKFGKFYNFQDYVAYYQESEKSLSNAYYRKSLKYNIVLTKKYGMQYPSFKKVILLRYCYYGYSFLPYNKELLPIFSRIKRMVFGKPSYKNSRAE